MNKSTAHILSFSSIRKTDIPLVGGKGANLGEMYSAGIPVPDGFVVTAKAYYDFLNTTSLRHKILTELSGLDVDDSKALQRASKNIKTAILAAQMPADLAKEIKRAYHKLSGEHDRLVAVRSSATAEDLPDASFAGQQETFLNIKGADNVIKNVQACWASLFEARAIFYRTENGFSHFKVGIAVPVQLMVQSEVSGIMFTVNPLTNNHREISIEAAYGLGQPIVSGEVTPDQYILNKDTLRIKTKYISKQTWQLTYAGKTKISKAYQKKQKLADKYVVKLAELGRKIEEHYGHPQDIEWAMEKGKLLIVQSRPVTTLKPKSSGERLAIKPALSEKYVLEGLAASPGVGVGPVKIIKSADELSRVKDGDVLVAVMTNPDFVPAMRRASAILTDEGGRTSHAAIVSRELGIPAVVGSKMATKILKEGEVITVDGSTGRVFSGDVSHKELVEEDPVDYANLKTATKIYMNLAEPDLADEMSGRNVDGVGLLRAEFMIAQMGKHPRMYIKQKKQKEFISTLADGLARFARAFEPRPVVYRFTDFRSNEYANLKGGKAFEAPEPNPMIGYRGVARYLEDPEVFKMEIEAIKKVRNEMGYKNLWVMFPFVRTVDQLVAVKRLMAEFGLRRSATFKVWMMAEIPANVLLLEDFLAVGIDGISIGTNDLTMLTLGVDRDNQKVAHIYSEMNPAVLKSLEILVRTCRKNRVTCSVCGQAPSVYPKLVKMLVKWGVTSVSVSPDVLDKTRKIVYDAERALLKERKAKRI